MSVVDDSFGHPLKLEQKASMLFAGGIGTQGYQCGMLWGAALAAGAQAHRIFGSGPKAQTAALLASQKTLESFRTRTKNEINCLEITDMNFQGDNVGRQVLKFLFKGGPINCFSMAAKYAPLAFNAINSSLTEEDITAATPPVSCKLLGHTGPKDGRIRDAYGHGGWAGGRDWLERRRLRGIRSRNLDQRNEPSR